MARRNAIYHVERIDQLRVLESPICLDLLDMAATQEEISVTELASLLGRSKNSLYPHVQRLVDVELLLPAGERQEGRHKSALYRTPAITHFIVYDPNDDECVEALKRAVAANLRLASRAVCKSLESREAVTKGKGRDTFCVRALGWLSKSELAEVNELIGRVQEIVGGGEPGKGRKLCGVTMAVAPADAS